MPARSKKTSSPDPTDTPESIAQDRPSVPESVRAAGATPPAPTTESARALAFAIEAARLAADDKCEQVVLLDVRAVSSITDYIVIASGTSDRQMQAVLDHLGELGQERNFALIRSGVDERTTWLVADFGTVFVHLFEPNVRAHYDLEMLWGDAPRVAWERPDQLRRDHAGLHRP